MQKQEEEKPWEENSQSNRGDDYGTLSSAEKSSQSRNSIWTRLQKVRYVRGKSTQWSVGMPVRVRLYGKPILLPEEAMEDTLENSSVCIGD